MVNPEPCFKNEEGGFPQGLALTNLHLPGFDCAVPQLLIGGVQLGLGGEHFWR